MRIGSWLAVSTLLHVVIFWKGVAPLSGADFAKPPLEFHIEEQEIQKVAASPKGGARPGRRGASSRSNKVQVGRLFQRYDFGEASGESSESLGGTSPDEFKNSENYLMDADNVFAANDNWEFHRQVFERIDSGLVFDSLLAQYNHFGSVYLQFAVSGKGFFLEKTLKASAEDPILKVHVVRALRGALRDEFPMSKWSTQEDPVYFQVKFEFLQGAASLNFAKQKEFAKPVLVIKRATAEKPIPNSLKDHLLSGGISHDPFAMAERWEKYRKKQRLAIGDYDPFASYRKDPAYN